MRLHELKLMNLASSMIAMAITTKRIMLLLYLCSSLYVRAFCLSFGQNVGSREAWVLFIFLEGVNPWFCVDALDTTPHLLCETA